MATTRFMTQHIRSGKTIMESLKDVDYGKNPNKTRNGDLVVAYECAPPHRRRDQLSHRGARPIYPLAFFHARQGLRAGGHTSGYRRPGKARPIRSGPLFTT